MHRGRVAYQSERSEFIMTDGSTLDHDRHALDYGAVVYCVSGSADIETNFDRWKLDTDNVLTLFPGDTVSWNGADEEFQAEALCYDASLLREASLNIEQAVYSGLKADRVCRDKSISRQVGRTMFDMLKYYFAGQGCQSIDRMVMLQLSTFFLGFYDHMTTVNPVLSDKPSKRVGELFSIFMKLVEEHYREWHDVTAYSKAMNITRKYLGTIVGRKTGLTPKTLIDEYIVLQLKLRLRTPELTLQQIASEFHFSDMSFFSRYFKAHTGLTPGKARSIYNS